MRAASAPEEQAALKRRYNQAVQDAEVRGARAVVEQFEMATMGSKAVIARSLRELDRIATSERELFSTYYKLLEGEVQLEHGNKWDGLRGVADDTLFPGYRSEIRFAALSLDGKGLHHYGEASFVLREDMIAHRASVYEENSVLFLRKHSYEPPPGHRATWADRAILCVAKLASWLTSSTETADFAKLLLRQGETPEDDQFVEVHIYGSMSVRTVQRVLVPPPKKGMVAVREALRERLRRMGMALEESL